MLLKNRGKRLLAVLLVAVSAGALLVFLIAGAGLLSDVIPLPGRQDFARPPCDQLPDKQSVVAALASHGDLTARLQNVGPGVKVEVATPCEGQPDRALVRISYRTKDELKGIDALLRNEGFGVPVELVRH